MSNINVLSEIPTGGSKVGKTSPLKGKTSTDNSGSAAGSFTEVLNGQVQGKSGTDSKGQSSAASHTTQGKQTTENSDSSSQTTNGQGTMMGLDNLAFPFFAQLMLQNELPAGKEANSGDDVSQGVEKSLTVNSASASNSSLLGGKTLELALLNLLSQSSDEVSSQLGKTVVKSQGNNPIISELDKYKQVIPDLLEKLSGEITDTSAMGTSINSGKSDSMSFSQTMAKIIQGWLEVPNEGTNQKGIQTVVEGSALGSGKSSSDQDSASILQAALNSLITEKDEEVKEPVLSAKVYDSMSGEDKNSPVLSAKAFLKSALDSLLSSTDEGLKDNAAAGLKDIAKVQDVLKQTLVNEEGQKSSVPSEEKDVQNLNPSLNMGLVNNTAAANITDVKTAATPVWQQIATVISGQVMNKPQDLKQLDIQLHPEDLGKIQIDLRWENGQLHLQVQASQGATGQLLQNQLPDLRQALLNQGINCGMLQMGLGGEGQKNPQGNGSSQTRQQNTNAAGDEDPIPALNIPSLEEDGISQINVTA
ncbi:flagellar hook-length control protein [Desulfosporosinus acidiphilus SJ4]|uniref:Flagellar hook-length control protein n=1 Tax=Desulfosporosinus acidiphilus (strain DSM 22704 / JCM 16185 / SJ4) TaxID=646529 RepID=I4DA61_DESAJ|nr:flagellar hook-length control protein FliK [Desulfosporosinus acidiphilus]AFM42685.1 flagellar hook-length control protein [Desulfosporosinus acidiphilus SJ4]